jgi:hypothetical protein
MSNFGNTLTTDPFATSPSVPFIGAKWSGTATAANNTYPNLNTATNLYSAPEIKVFNNTGIVVTVVGLYVIRALFRTSANVATTAAIEIYFQTVDANGNLINTNSSADGLGLGTTNHLEVSHSVEIFSQGLGKGYTGSPYNECLLGFWVNQPAATTSNWELSIRKVA